MQNIPLSIQGVTFLTSFFSLTVIEWNNLDQNTRNSSCLNIFRDTILKFIRPSANTVFNSHNPRRTNLSQECGLV